MLWVRQGRHGIHERDRKEKQRLYKCISRESNPGHIDGNGVFYHWTTDASDQEILGRDFDRNQQDMEEEFSRSAETMDFLAGRLSCGTCFQIRCETAWPSGCLASVTASPAEPPRMNQRGTFLPLFAAPHAGSTNSDIA